MSVEVVMPQMGESIAEGTMVKWLKSVGDHVERDEPLFEISTDKVDAEIPSPAEGVLLQIIVDEGQTVEINTVVGRIGDESEVGASKPQEEPAAPTPTTQPVETPPAPAPAATATLEPRASGTRRPPKSSPVVRKIADQHGIDVALIDGTGSAGRVTRQDILTYIERIGQVAPAATPAAPTSSAAVFSAGEDEYREKMSVMRKKIAEHMIMSTQVSAHVYSVFEVDMHNVVNHRALLKPEFAREGVKLTFLPFFMEAVIRGIKEHPIINASVDGDEIVYKRDVNLGIAVALENGLIVPVVKKADRMSLLGLAQGAGDVAERARSKRLVPDDVQGGTFTITNVGVFGGLFGMPIINQPQLAIMGIGTIEKKPVVINDAIAIRPRCHISLSYDHRVIDGMAASLFLGAVKRELEKPID